MIIRVETFDELVYDIANFLGKGVPELLYEIEYIDFNMGDIKGYTYIAENKRANLTAVYLCHIARKLNGTDVPLILPLNKLLLSNNPFSSFLQENDIQFFKGVTGCPDLIYKGNKVDWGNCRNRVFNPARFRSRLNGDYCVNGFQFLYDIKNSAGGSYNLYSKAPELLQDLDYLLNLGLVSEFTKISKPYCALCSIPIDNIVFDYNSADGRFEDRYIYSSLSYIWEYHYAKRPIGTNPILRALDDYAATVEKWIPDECTICHG